MKLFCITTKELFLSDFKLNYESFSLSMLLLKSSNNLCSTRRELLQSVLLFEKLFLLRNNWNVFFPRHDVCSKLVQQVVGVQRGRESVETLHFSQLKIAYTIMINGIKWVFSPPYSFNSCSTNDGTKSCWVSLTTVLNCGWTAIQSKVFRAIWKVRWGSVDSMIQKTVIYRLHKLPTIVEAIKWEPLDNLWWQFLNRWLILSSSFHDFL